MDADRKKVTEETFRQLLEQARLPEDEVTSRLEKAADPGYWEKLNPCLSVNRQPSSDALETGTLDSRRRDQLLEMLREEGYFQTEPLISNSLIQRMRGCIEALRREHWPPVFAFVYDEFWQVTRIPSIVQLLSAVLGPGYRQNCHIWCYYILPHSRSRGWRPHIDGFNMPDRLTLWIALSDATLENGCMYVIPQYLVPETIVDFSRLKNVSVADMKVLLQSARALPARAGSVLGWNFQLIHWGSTCRHAEHPRISIAVEFVGMRSEPTSDELPLFSGHSALPAFPERLDAIGKGILEYKKFEPLLVMYQDLAKRLVERIGIA